MRTLLTYATSHSTTAEISTQIYKIITLHNPNIDLIPIEDVSSTDLQKYTAVIIGSAVHGMRWLPPATKFLETNGPTLQRMPVWAFSVGAPVAMPKLVQKMGMNEVQESEILLKEIKKALSAGEGKGEVQPITTGPGALKEGLQDHVFFEGKFEKSDAGLVIKTIWAVGGGKFGDFRDESAIEGWAKKVAGDIAGVEKNETIMTMGPVEGEPEPAANVVQTLA